MPGAILLGKDSSTGCGVARDCGVAGVDRSGGVEVRFLLAGSPPREALADFLFLSILFNWFPSEFKMSSCQLKCFELP